MSKRSRLPLALLALLAFLPALAVLPGWREGRVVFVLYREPKLALALPLAWALLAVLALRLETVLPVRRLTATLRRPPIVLLLLFTGWAAITGLWTAVPANWHYELVQHATGALLVVALVAWGSTEPRVAPTIVRAVAASLGVVTVVGMVQLLRPLAWLPPIDPGYGVTNPSLMGYKNPMALALVGQLYLLGWLVVRREARRRARIGWGLLLATELAYLATLQSRTAYAALVLTALLLAILVTLRALRAGAAGSRERTRSRRTAAATWAGLAAAGVLFAAVVAAHPRARARLASAAAHLADPALYLASDRGVYLRNTLAMAHHRPLGVGLGDWQTWYPLYRVHDRYRSFTDRHQVRRAHSDPVQLLGETGWPGAALWIGFLGLAVGGACRRYLRTGDALALAAGVQLAALAVAMATDYLLEMPYHKLLLYLVAAVALVRRPSTGAGDRPPAGADRVRPSRPVASAGALLVIACGVAATTWSTASLIRARQGAAIEERYLAAGALRRTAPLDRLAADGRRLERLPGHTKSLYKDFLILAHVAALRGDADRAVALARESLRLHPHYPNALELLSVLHADEDPAAAGAYRLAHAYVMDEATDGRPPVLPPH